MMPMTGAMTNPSPARFPNVAAAKAMSTETTNNVALRRGDDQSPSPSMRAPSTRNGTDSTAAAKKFHVIAKNAKNGTNATIAPRRIFVQSLTDSVWLAECSLSLASFRNSMSS